MKAKSKSGKIIAEQCDLESCPIANAVAMFSGKWKLMIVLQLSIRPAYRYGELRRRLTGITERVFVRQLKEMEVAGLIQRKTFVTVPPKVEYALTPMGKDLLPVLDLLRKWAERYGPEE